MWIADEAEGQDGTDWDEIHAFTSPGEYARFQQWLREATWPATVERR